MDSRTDSEIRVENILKHFPTNATDAMIVKFLKVSRQDCLRLRSEQNNTIEDFEQKLFGTKDLPIN